VRDVASFHPFPARMAPELALDGLKSLDPGSLVVDPMMGSGTVLSAARRAGHKTLGFDLDPLAVRLGHLAIDPPSRRQFLEAVGECVGSATVLARLRTRYPAYANYETRRFIDYWFDRGNQIQLNALASAISTFREARIRVALEVVLSSTIITKTSGVSLSADAPHSRPHRVHDVSPQRALAFFEIKASKLAERLPEAVMERLGSSALRGDARALPLARSSVDRIVTSPPYLNAIDYLRGHKLSLVWLGFNIDELRELRGESVGSMRSRSGDEPLLALLNIAEMSPRHGKIATRYVNDLSQIVAEWSRVLAPGGRCTCVIGDAYADGVLLDNGALVERLGQRNGMRLSGHTIRTIPDHLRYLPPPSRTSGTLARRMRSEHVITLIKE
jgi:hypothetical protein